MRVGFQPTGLRGDRDSGSLTVKFLVSRPSRDLEAVRFEVAALKRRAIFESSR